MKLVDQVNPGETSDPSLSSLSKSLSAVSDLDGLKPDN